MKRDIMLLIMFLIVEGQLLWYRYKPLYLNFKKSKDNDIIKNLANRQKEEDLVVEKDKDITDIDEYINYVKSFIDSYHKSRSKKISYRTRQDLLFKTIQILPVVSKHITLNYYYNLEDKEWYKLTDRDMVMILESAYNDYTHDNLDSLNSIITAVLRLRDDKR